MRFKAKLINPSYLYKIFQALDKVQKGCIFKLSSKSLKFISKSATLSDSLQVWASIKTSSLFSEFRIENTSCNNDIYCDIYDLRLALKALKIVSKEAAFVTMKLTKRYNIPFLTLEAQVATSLATGEIRNVDVVQEFPIKILKSEDLTDYMEPSLGEDPPKAQIYLPQPLKDLKTIVDRMKAMSEKVTLKVSMANKLQLNIHTSVVSVQSHYNNLNHPQDEREENAIDPDIIAEAVVDLKQFSKFMHCYLITPIDTVCAIYEERVVVMFCKANDDLSLTYYLPVEVRQ